MPGVRTSQFGREFDRAIRDGKSYEEAIAMATKRSEVTPETAEKLKTNGTMKRLGRTLRQLYYGPRYAEAEKKRTIKKTVRTRTRPPKLKDQSEIIEDRLKAAGVTEKEIAQLKAGGELWRKQE